MLAVAVLLGFLSVAFAKDDHVLELKESDFNDVIGQHAVVLVKFYAPWCGHCKRLAPEYAEAAKLLSEKTPPVTLAKVDCTAEASLCSKYDVSGYPTLKVFMNGNFHSDYAGPRDAAGIAKYMLSRAGPASTELKTKADLESTLSDDKPTVIAFVKTSTDAFMKEYMGLASELIDVVKFLHTHVDVIGTSDNIKLRLYLPKQLRSKFEEHFVSYKGEVKIPGVKEWIRSNGQGLCGYRSQGSEFFFEDSNLIVIYNNHTLENYPSGVKYLRNRILKAIKTVPDTARLRFAYSPSDQFSMEMSEYGFEFPYKLPAARVRSQNGKKFRLEEYSFEAFVAFVKGFLDESLTPYLKSEPISTTGDGPLKHVVALNFDEIVNDPTKDVMVVFHAHWCGHCKSLMPKYEKAAEQLKSEPSVLLVAVNAVTNDVPKPFEVSGFPTIYFVPKSDKKTPKLYQGGRETEDIVKYVAQEATDELVGFDRSGNRRKTEL